MERENNENKHIDKKALNAKILSQNNQNIKILTIQEVADLLRIHRSTVTRLAKSGEIKSSLIGSRRLFKDIDVWSFFENQVDRGYVFGEEL